MKMQRAACALGGAALALAACLPGPANWPPASPPPPNSAPVWTAEPTPLFATSTATGLPHTPAAVSSSTALPLPTQTSAPASPPAPSPTAVPSPSPVPVPAEGYRAQSGDTLASIARRFDVEPRALLDRNPGLPLTQTIAPGLRVDMPAPAVSAQAYSARLLPDSAVVYVPSAAGFDVRAFVQSRPGFLAAYSEYREDRQAWQAGWEIVQSYARDYSINPRLLLALLEFQSQALTDPAPPDYVRERPLGVEAPGLKPGLSRQLGWASNQINRYYYGWREGVGPRLWLPSGGYLLMDGGQNAGTYAVAGFFAQLYGRSALDRALSPEGFIATYWRLFGDPFLNAPDPLIPGELTQPVMQLPFESNVKWYYTSGPHPPWGYTLPLAALDFAPPAADPGCALSKAWAVAVRDGLVVRSEAGVVELDVGGGWSAVYLHLAVQDRVPQWTAVRAGDRLGHPSCEGGNATAVHLHLARKYNGEWIAADGPAPFDLSGWVAQRGTRSYLGALMRGNTVIVACACGGASTAVGIER